MKINQKNIVLSSSATTKKSLFKELSEVGKILGVVKDAKKLEKGFWDREEEGSTGMEYTFAIPHAKMDSITEPTIIVLKTKTHIKDYKTFDNSKVKNIIALLIPNKNIQKDQMRILSSIAVKLTDEKFRKEIINSKTKKDLVEIMNKIDFSEKKVIKKEPSKKDGFKFVGITSCAAGIAHTFISAENLVKSGEKLGHLVRIETQGASGPETELTDKEIKEADFVVIASDIDVDMSRFNGKKVYRTNVSHAVRNAEEVLVFAMQKSSTQKGENLAGSSSPGGKKKGILQAIMNGVSWMIPLLVAAAVLLAIPNIAGAIVGKSDVVSQGSWKDYVSNGLTSPWWRFMYVMMHMGWSSISLMFPIFAAFTAMAIGNKPAFIPGLIGGFLAKPTMFYGDFSDSAFTAGSYPFLNTSSGFWGALIIGLLVGYVMLFANKYIKVPKIMNAVKPMLILPFIGSVFSITMMILVINPPFGYLNEKLINFAKDSGDNGKYILSLAIAPMTAADLGGPINKAAGTVMNTFYASRTISLTIRVIPTITPSIGLGLAAIFDKYIVRRRVFDAELRMAAPNAIILAMLGISEGGLPFMFRRPLLTIPVNMIGGLIGSFVGVMTGTEQWFPDSAIWAWPFAKPIWGLLLAIFISSVATMLMHIFLRLFLIKIGKLDINAEPVKKVAWKNLFKKKVVSNEKN